MTMTFLFSLLLLLGTLRTVSSFPTGAGGCEGGQASVEGSHLDTSKTVLQTGTLDDGQVQVSVNGSPLNTGAVLPVQVGKDYTVTVAASGAPIRGILIRSQCTIDLTDSLLPDDDLTQVAQICDGQSADNSVVGITHTSSAPKTRISSLLNIPDRTTISFDVTVVMANNATHSIYYYTGYSIRATYPVCEVCGEGLVVGDRDAFIPQMEADDINCGEIEDAGLTNRISPDNCATVQILAPLSCSCTLQATGPPPTAPTPPVPSTTTAPPPAPTNAPPTTTTTTSPPTNDTPTIPPKKVPPEDDDKDDSKLWAETDRGNLNRLRTLRGM